MHLHIEWDERKAASNWRKHGISFEDATDVFYDPLSMTMHDEDHSEQEERWVMIGQVEGRKLVVVVHTWHEAGDDYVHVRIISARPATRHEAQQYQR